VGIVSGVQANGSLVATQGNWNDEVMTGQPGGTPLGKSLRELLLHEPMDLATETLLMFADRRQHIVDVIAPALARGAWVVCDRFTDSTVAYQGGGRGLGLDRLDVLRAWVHPDLEPGTTILFDLAPAIAKARLDAGRSKDRFEEESVAFFDRVREAYFALAASRPGRYRVVDGATTIAEIRKSLDEIIATIC